MPAIKKKWMQSNMEDTSVRNESESFDDDEWEKADSDLDVTVKVTIKPVVKPADHTVPTAAMLRGLDGEVLLEKRKRFIPPAELKLSDWLDNNLEKRTEETIHLPLLYKYYTELCQASGSDILDVPKFNQMIKTKFGKSFGVQASSIYKAVIKEKKVGEKKKKSGGGWKMKEIVIEAINHFGNPWQGVRFFSIKQYVAARYPALQIDAKTKMLKRALEMGTNYGYVEVTKGVGKMGWYRLPGAVEPPPKPKNKPKKENENDVGDGKEGEEDQTSKGEKEGNGAIDGSDATEEDSTEKPADSEAASKEESTDAKPKKTKKVQAWSYSKISYSNPARIEDTFPLAITYQSAPKAAALSRIRRYILEKYGEEVTDSRWRKCLDHGVDKGFWEYVSGSGISGRIHLLMDDFDPNSDRLEERICAAVIACHDPKSASAQQIKKYVSQYHPNFGIDTKPDRFKKALIRAVEKKMIKQLSGLGASGTFILVVPFTPSPSVLAGDDESDQEDDDYDEPESTYVPRGTKSRGMPKVKTMEIIKSKKTVKASASTSQGGGGARKKSQNNTRKLVVSPVAKKRKSAGSEKKSKTARSKGKARSSNSSGGKRSKKRNVRRSPSPLTDEEEDEDRVEYTPRKSQSRGGNASSNSRNSTLSFSKAKTSAKKGGKNQTPKPTVPKEQVGRLGGRESSSKKDLSPVVFLSNIDSDKESVDLTSKKSNSRTGGNRSSGSAVKSKQNGTLRSPQKRKVEIYSDDGDEEDDYVEYTPRKTASRGGGNKMSSLKSKAPKKRKADSDFDDDDNEDYRTASPKSREKSAGGKKKSRR